MKRTLFLSLLAIAALGLANLHAGDDALAKGKKIYEGIGACVTCHGPAGKGDGAAAATLNPKPRNFAKGDFLYDTDKDGKKGTEADLMNIVTNGAVKYGGSPLMPPRPDIKGDDLKVLVTYVLSLNENKKK